MKVRVVDDNPISRLLPIAWLKRSGCEAVESARRRHGRTRQGAGGDFDAMLLEPSMPGLSGTEICRLVRATAAGGALRIVACTAHAAPDAVEGFKAAGFDGVLIKPITRDALFAALARQ